MTSDVRDETATPTAPTAGSDGERRAVVGGVVVYVAVRLVTLVATLVAAYDHHKDGRVLFKADGQWYLLIAQHGYGHPPPIGPDGAYVRTTPLAFFPLYPWTIRWLGDLGIGDRPAALLVTAACGVLAAAFVAAWGHRVAGPRPAVLLVGIWALLPSAAVLGLAYSEALFVAAAAGVLLALQRGRLLAAAAGAVVAGLTRPTAGGLVAAVAVAAALQVWRERRLGWRPVAAVLLAPLGLVVSLVHVARATGRWDGWFWLERTAWNSGFDGGRDALEQGRLLLTGGLAGGRLVTGVALATCVLWVALLVRWLLARPRPSAPDVTYAVSATLLALGQRHYVNVKPRLLLVAFPVLLPLARAAARLRPVALLAWTIPVLVLSVWWNVYLVVYWTQSV